MTVVQCPVCTGKLVEITVIVKAGDLTMRSCSVCDQRYWFVGDRAVELPALMARLEDRPGKLEFKRAS